MLVPPLIPPVIPGAGKPSNFPFSDGPDDQMPFGVVILIESVITGLGIREVVEKLLRFLVVVEVLVDVHLSRGRQRPDWETTGAATKAHPLPETIQHPGAS